MSNFPSIPLPSPTDAPPSSAAMPTASTKNDGAGEWLAMSDAEQERDLGSLDLSDEYGDWEDDYADAVGISRLSEI